jgi:predicted nucleotidyltransferase
MLAGERMELTPEALAIYRKTALRRWKRSTPERLRLQEQAWAEARRAATLLRERFGATRVAVFGSLVHPGCFTRWSDIDLAVWGILPEDVFRAIGAVMDLQGSFDINLVEIQSARPAIRQVIEQEGVDI